MTTPEEPVVNSEFNPYRVWLGIPQNKLPADHYTLLGLSKYESDLDVIESAADKVMAYVKTFQAGKYSQQSQQLLNELSAARVCLLNEKTKAEYDAQLRAKEPATPTPVQGATPIPVAVVAPPIAPPPSGLTAPPKVSENSSPFAFDMNLPEGSKTRVSGIHSRGGKSSIGKKNNEAVTGKEKKSDRKDSAGGAYVKKSGGKKTTSGFPLWALLGGGALALALLAGALMFLLGSSGKETIADSDTESETDFNNNSDSNLETTVTQPVKQEEPVKKNDSDKTDSDKKEEANTGVSAQNKDDSLTNESDVITTENKDTHDSVLDEADIKETDSEQNNTGEFDFNMPEADSDTPVVTGTKDGDVVQTDVSDVASKLTTTTQPDKPKKITHTVEGKEFPKGIHAGDKHVVTVDDIKYTFRWIPSGTFTMGSPSSEPGHQDNETTHTETIATGFWALETEVTAEMYASVMGQSAPAESAKLLPAKSISWSDARLFCIKLSRLTGMNISLPTETQWEYACRAGTSSAYNFGAKKAELCKNGNYCDKSFPEGNPDNPDSARDPYHDDGFASVAPVKSFSPNAWGLYDMHGNVSEWVLSPCNQPVDEKNTKSGVFKGGSYRSSACDCRSAARGAISYPSDHNGFRIIRRDGSLPALATNTPRRCMTDKTKVDGDLLKPGKQPGQRARKKLDDVVFTFRWIPAGKGREFKTTPEARDIVITNGFWMLETEVTQQMYEKVMGNNPSEFVGKDNPVECVSWEDAQKFCHKLSEKWSDVEVFLPTEAQWVYAGRANKPELDYITGDSLAIKDANCNAELPCSGLKSGTFLASTRPTGSYSPNEWGLYDMHGNVAEWCFDRFESQYRWGRNKDRIFYAPVGPLAGTNRIIRGGSWFSSYESAKFSGGYTSQTPSTKNSQVGFRICTFPNGVSYEGSQQQSGDISGLFSNQPDAVDLPEKKSDSYTTLLTLPATQYQWKLSAVGLNSIRQTGFTYEFAPVSKESNNKEWTYTMKTSQGDAEIARIKRDGSTLQFKFTDITGLEQAQMIRNTILKIQIGDDIHYLALRKPYIISDSMFNFFEGKKSWQPNLKHIPSSAKFEIYPLEGSPLPSINSTLPEMITKSGYIQFLMDGKPSNLIALRFDFEPNRELKTNIVIEANKLMAQRLAMYPSNKEKMNTEANKAKNLIISIKKNVKTASVKEKAEMKKDLPIAILQVWSTDFMKNALDKETYLHFEVYQDCGGRRVTIMTTEPTPIYTSGN